VAKIYPFHSTIPSDRAVHHDSNACPEGQEIPLTNRRDGTGGRPQCERCQKLNETERF
jgi:hypothetical protein